MPLQEPRHDVSSESERHSSIVLRPSGDILVRVRPEKIAEETLIVKANEQKVSFELNNLELLKTKKIEATHQYRERR